jgi:hypothetical protein
MSCASWMLGIAAAVVALGVTSSAQQPSVPGSQTKEDQEGTKRKGEHPGTSNNRLFGALPDFLTVENAENVPPLSTKEKFDVTIRSTFDLGQYLFYGGLAGISQADNACSARIPDITVWEKEASGIGRVTRSAGSS